MVEVIVRVIRAKGICRLCDRNVVQLIVLGLRRFFVEGNRSAVSMSVIHVEKLSWAARYRKPICHQP